MRSERNHNNNKPHVRVSEGLLRAMSAAEAGREMQRKVGQDGEDDEEGNATKMFKHKRLDKKNKPGVVKESKKKKRDED